MQKDYCNGGGGFGKMGRKCALGRGQGKISQGVDIMM